MMAQPSSSKRCEWRRAVISQHAPSAGPLPDAGIAIATTRYSDLPMPLGTRILGLGGTTGMALLILAGALLTWTARTIPQAQPTLSTFNVAPPAAPPDPVREVPPGPEQVQKDKAAPKVVKIDTPTTLAIVPSMITAAPPKLSSADPGPSVKDTTAPVSKIAPPAPKVSNSKPTWQGLVLSALDRVKHYPRAAHFTRQQGMPYIRFVMNRQGKVLLVELERSSGVRSLDEEALALPKRAEPLPIPPEDVEGETLEFMVPVEFFLR